MLNSTSKLPGNVKMSSALTKKTRLSTLLLSSAGSALAVALAGSFSPAQAACTITDAGTPWTIVCTAAVEAATNPNPAVGPWPGTNSYTSPNGLTVTIADGASVTPATGTWYFGASTDGTDSGGAFGFLNGDGILSNPVPVINGSVMVAGNVQLVSNNANFTNFGDITGSAGIGTGPGGGSAYWMGGNVTVFNGLAGVIGGDLTVYSGSEGGAAANPSAPQVFTNQGEIGGNVLLSTDGSFLAAVLANTVNPGTPVYNNMTINGWTEVAVTTSGNGVLSTTSTYNGGQITGSNSGNIGGGIGIFAPAGATLTSSGNIGGPVNVVADPFSTSYSATSTTVASYTQLGPTFNFTTSSNNQTVTFTGESIGAALSYDAAPSFAWSSTTFSQTFSTGGIATLNNSGTMGSSILPLTQVNVIGDLGAGATNTGSIYGNVLVQSFNSHANQTGTAIGGCFSFYSHSSSDVVVYSPAVIGATASFLQSSYDTSAATSASSDTSSTSYTQNWLGGNASLINSSLIAGDVTVAAADTASLINTGAIVLDPMVVANVFNLSSTSVEVTATVTSTNNSTNYLTDNTSAGNFLQTFAYSTFGYSSQTIGCITSNVTMSTGGVATLTNSGNIGASVSVIGQAIGNAVNSGLIIGDVTVSAFAVTTTTGLTQNYGSWGNFSGTTTYTVNTGVNMVPFAPGTTLTSAETYSSVFFNSSTNAYSTVVTYTGGVASLNNSGNITGDATVAGVTSATLINSGLIFDPVVSANAINTNFSYSSIKSYSSSGSESLTATGAFVASGNLTNFIQTVTHGYVYGYGSVENISTASTSATVGGVALLINSGNIGASGMNVPVLVTGQDSANLTNSGIIFANGVTVQAIDFSSTVLNSLSLGASYGQGNTSFEVINSGNNTTLGLGAVGIIMQGTFSSASNETATSVTNATTTTTYSGGNASLINSGNITGTGAVSVVGVDSALLINSGHILDPYVIANAFNTSSNLSVSFGSADSLSVTGNYSGAFVASGNTSNFIQTTSTTSIEVYTSSYGSSVSSTTASTGGVATLINTANATIGSAVNYTPVVVMGQASANLTNAGTIYSGMITVEAIGSTASYLNTSAGNYSQSSTDITYSVVNTGNNTTPGVAGQTLSSGYSLASADTSSWTSTTSSTFTYNGGTAVLNNSGVIKSVGGTVSVEGITSATLLNSGNMTESNINVLSTGINTVSVTLSGGTTGHTSNDVFNAIYSYSPSGNATTATVTSGVGSGNSSFIGASSETTSATATSAGGTALVNNSGIISGGNSSLTLNVTGDTSATLINTGAIEFGVGNLLSGGVLVNVQSISGNAAIMFGCVSTYTDSYAWGFSSTSVTTGNATPNFMQASVSSETNSASGTTSRTFSYSTYQTGGVANLTNSGNIGGSAIVTGVLGASLNNSGFIGQSFGTITVQASQTFFTANGNLTALTASSEVVSNSFSGNLSNSFSKASSETFSGTFASSSSSSITGATTGGNASLVNTGVIGIGNVSKLTTSAPMTILVAGGANGSATNSGTIFGAVTVTAGLSAGSATSSDAFNGTSQETFTNVSTYTAGNMASSTYTSADNGSWSYSTVVSTLTVMNVTGGVASLANSGNITGDVAVYGNANASVTNGPGLIGGNVTASALALNTASASSEVDTHQGTWTLSENTSYATNSVTTQWSSVSTESSVFTDTSSYVASISSSTASQLSTASLANTGIIGNKTIPVNVLVTADTNASTVNSGTIYGNLSDAALAFVSVTTYTDNWFGTYSHNSSETINTAGGNIVVSGNTVDIYPSYTPSASGSFAGTWASSETITTLSSYNVTGGVANVTNSGKGKLIGSVLVSGPAGATLTNSGTVSGVANGWLTGFVDVIGTGANTLYVTNYTTADHGSDSGTSAETTTLAFSSGGNFANVTATTYTNLDSYAYTDTRTTSSSSNYTSMAAGTNATLVNTGSIGTSNASASVSVDVAANGVASLTNSGIIWADGGISVTASSPSYSSANTQSASSTSADSYSNSYTHITNTGNVPSYYPSQASSSSYSSCRWLHDSGDADLFDQGRDRFAGQQHRRRHYHREHSGFRRYDRIGDQFRRYRPRNLGPAALL